MALNGRFDFNSHREFRDGYDSLLRDGTVKELELDLANVSYLDSSALGMLLLFKERAAAVNKSIVLVNCRGIVAQVLEVANFNKLFTIR
jgi:anti-anti-sigma factor